MTEPFTRDELNQLAGLMGVVVWIRAEQLRANAACETVLTLVVDDIAVKRCAEQYAQANRFFRRISQMLNEPPLLPCGHKNPEQCDVTCSRGAPKG